MAKEIWVGPVLSANRNRLIERCAGLISEGKSNSFLYLAASRSLLEKVTGELLDGVHRPGIWGSLPVHLFRGLVRQVLSSAIESETGRPLANRVPIDRETLPLKRSLVAQLMRRLASEQKLQAIPALVHTEGCVNSVCSLIGEIQRAGKRPEQFNSIIEARAQDYAGASDAVSGQVGFDRDVAVVYSAYHSLLDRFQLTEDDADQLRALSVLGGEVEGKQVSVSWLAQIQLLILDGFFDFTPVQGEMLRLLIPAIPEVIVNLNGDERNPEVFRPYRDTIDQLSSMAEFEIRVSKEEVQVAAGLSRLRARLFNSEAPGLADSVNFAAQPSNHNETDSFEGTTDSTKSKPGAANTITLLECTDRETEIRTIAKEIKRLVFDEGYRLDEIALVVRERTHYSAAVVRILADERIPCAVEHSLLPSEIPAVRGALKLFHLLRELNEENSRNAKISDLTDLIKSEYFRPSDDDLAVLRERFKREHEDLLGGWAIARTSFSEILRWNPDKFENIIAFVGSELRVEDWLKRARRLTFRFPSLELADEEGGDSEDPSTTTDLKSESAVDRPGSDVKPKPSRDVHPGAISWTASLVEHLAHLFDTVPREGEPLELRRSVLKLIERLQFASLVKQPVDDQDPDSSLEATTLDLRGLEAIRRAFTAAIRSIELADDVPAAPSFEQRSASIRLSTVLEESIRCLKGQGFRVAGADPNGLLVLEPTDVRGLHFRALFIAGLIEGGFPLRTPRDWIYPQDERERLKEYGLNLEDISPETLLKEEHYFYQAACRATERLYLSRPLMLEDETETVPSYYIEETRQAVAPFQIDSEIARRDFEGDNLLQASTKSEAAISLVRLSEKQEGRVRELEPGFYDSEAPLSFAVEHGWISGSAIERIRVERERAGQWFGQFDGEITNPALLDLLKSQFGPSHVYSASEFSVYGKCPFKFFAERVLKLQPRGEAALDLKALDAGKLLHEVLKRFFERHRSERLSTRECTRLRQELRQIADEVFDEHERLVPPLNPQVWRIDREIRKVLLDQVLSYELELQKGPMGMLPSYFELAFGMTDSESDPSSTDRYLEVRHGTEEDRDSIMVRGRIDRVDVAADKSAIAYDYKLSRGASQADMESGRDLQMGIYLSALEQLLLPGHMIAGGGYYILRTQKRNRGLYREKFSERTGIKPSVGSNLSEDEWQRARQEMEARMWEFTGGMRAGKFRVIPSAPKETCPYCDFSAVCRYEVFRIRGKGK